MSPIVDKGWKSDWPARRAEWRAVKKAGGRGPESMGPPNGFALLPWLLMGMGAFSNLIKGETDNPWVGGLSILTFNSLYIYVVLRAFDPKSREALSTKLALAGLGLIAGFMSVMYGGPWLLFFMLTGLATGAVIRGPKVGRAMLVLAVLAGGIAAWKDGWNAINIAYGTLISGLVTSAILTLADTVKELRATRQELARTAVEKERLRFSRDLHDLLGHTLSVIVVKSEAARRLAPRDLDAALTQVSDIESVGRQALTEIREAVSGYREGSLSTELDGARSALSAAGIEPVVRQSGPPLEPQTEALLGWVVREAVTNVVRHGEGAARCTISVEGTAERVRLEVVDDGRAPTVQAPTGSGTGLKGLTERLATAGGSLTAGPGPRGGFAVRAELPVGARDVAAP
ncbi:sensor histidine kinase [Streptomyces sp. NBC_00237]|uniref:sensor histidine kinase n=1 Tax=Streptomyces sp. NBC_00237 TaxID=2975687 RepID=UPI002253EEBC|nr:sensor histidine kinase [Streptomyces sp. NBC_00237]MCX5201551.1 sensor histidine kinase [Streptomyces sp. NBC_00237]